MKTVRIEVDNEVWQKVRAKAILEEKTVKEFAGELFEKEVEDFDSYKTYVENQGK